MLSKMSHLALLMLIALSVTAKTAEAQSFTPEDLSFTVYADGYVFVDYSLKVDPTRDRVSLKLFGSLYQELIVEDQDGLLLDYSQSDGLVTVFTLGSTVIRFTYETPDLTNKTANMWSFAASTPIAARIVLPENSTVVYLNTVPNSIESLDGKPLLTMPAGDIAISYIVSMTGTRENALAAIKDAEFTINSIKAKGVSVVEAEAKLQQASAAFNLGEYLKAEQLANQAKELAISANAAALSAQEAINAATEAVARAKNESRAVGLDEAERLLQKAIKSMNSRDYASALSSALQAQAAAAKAAKPFLQDFIIPGLLGGSAIALTVGFILWRRGKKPSGPRVTGLTGAGEPKGPVNLDMIFEAKKNLRFEDKEVLRFLAESNGEAFASEIRDRFEMPRASAWRMIRRLKNEGLVEVRSVAGQSLVRIKPRFRGVG